MPVKKILHVIPSVGPLRGGPSVVVRQMAASLAHAGLETHVATTNDNGPGTLPVRCGAPVPSDDGVTYWYFPRQTRFYTFSWPLSTWLARHVAEFDVLHIHALFSFATLPAAFWARRHGVPYIVRPLGTLNQWGMANRRPWLKRLSFNLLERRVVAHAARMHYTSHQEQIEAEKLHVTTPAAVIPNAVNAARGAAGGVCLVDRFPQLAGRPVVLFLSRLDPKKGLDLLVDAFAQVRARIPRAALLVAGDGDEEFVKSLQARARGLGLANDIVWSGFLDGDDKQAAFGGADVFVLPSYSENFGNVVAEAMAMALPVVVTDQVAIHDDVRAAEAGLVVPCDKDRLADALTRLLADQALRHAMGEQGRALSRDRYSPDAVTRRLIDVYNDVTQ